MLKKNLLIVLIALPVVLSAQIDTLKLNRQFIQKGWRDTKKLVTAPARWDSRDWTTAGVLTASLAALTLVDQPVQDAFQDWHTQADKSGERITANFLEPLGEEYALAVIGGFMAHGLLAGNSKSQSTALLAGESFLLASLFVQIPKRLIGRARPDTGADPFEFNGPLEGTGFPSGHTTAAFAVASVIANQYADTPAVPIISYSIATAAGLSRIYDNRHWLSDVAGGAVLGILVGNLVSEKYNKNTRVALVPFRSGPIQGVKLAYTL
ncbi:phosphatase PAP2 family protein [uncultured Sunxiuqinia sp.]|uniref:phosphatase PAP2 family protein n=1 Tax=uncultured Sunxiuqinia sp. TaxID=1573825 RepID=UPI002626BD3E|nr:phosphatase PAP2 family protein [uncultured Sunxiuqinia sp.]